MGRTSRDVSRQGGSRNQLDAVVRSVQERFADNCVAVSAIFGSPDHPEAVASCPRQITGSGWRRFTTRAINGTSGKGRRPRQPSPFRGRGVVCLLDPGNKGHHRCAGSLAWPSSRSLAQRCAGSATSPTARPMPTAPGTGTEETDRRSPFLDPGHPTRDAYRSWHDPQPLVGMGGPPPRREFGLPGHAGHPDSGMINRCAKHWSHLQGNGRHVVGSPVWHGSNSESGESCVDRLAQEPHSRVGFSRPD